MKRCCECHEEKPLTDFHKSVKHKGYAPRCKPCAIRVSGDWYAANKDKKRVYDAKRRVEKRHLYRAASKRFRENNPGRKNADTQARRAAFDKRCPPWANTFLISEIYDLAALRTKVTGYRWVVDHVIPLRGKAVSGLHVETNLRVIPELLNLSKSNTFTHEGVK